MTYAPLWLLLASAAGFLIGRAGAGPTETDLRDAATARIEGTTAGWSTYLERHPDGFHAPEARTWIDEPAQHPPPPRADALRSEIRFWEERFAVAAQPAPSAKAGAIADRPPVAPLAADADRDAVDAYLVAVQRRLETVKRLRPDDPDKALLRGIPHAHLDLLLEAWASTRAPSFATLAEQTVPTLLTDADQDLVRAWLVRQPSLIRVVLDRKWERDLHDTIAAQVKTVRQPEQQVLWVRALVRTDDPRDRALLTEVLIGTASGAWRRDIYRELGNLPGFPIQETVERCWATRKTDEAADAFLTIAAEHGIREALELVVARVDKPSRSLSREKAEAWLGERTDAPEDRSRLAAWLGKPPDAPRFDPAARRWLRGSGPRGDF